MIRPSSLPMLFKCARFHGDGGACAEAGTVRHKALAAMLNGSNEAEALVDALDDESRAGVQWAFDYIKLKASSEFPLHVEQKLEWMRPNFDTVSGTPDSFCRSGEQIADLFDFKWRRRDYVAQLADYAIGVMDYLPAGKVRVHILFGAEQRVQALEFNRSEAETVVLDVIDRVAEQPEPRVNEYCSWCSECIRCAPYLKRAEAAANGYAEEPEIKEWHPSKIESGPEMAAALRVARMLKKWIASVEHHALEAATKQGLTLPGFELKTKKGKQYCPDVAGAFGLCGLPQAEFLKCCDLRLNKSRSYADKQGVVNAYAALHGMKTAPAKRELLKKLEPVLKESKPSTYLKAEKESDDESED